MIYRPIDDDGRLRGLRATELDSSILRFSKAADDDFEGIITRGFDDEWLEGADLRVRTALAGYDDAIIVCGALLLPTLEKQRRHMRAWQVRASSREADETFSLMRAGHALTRR